MTDPFQRFIDEREILVKAGEKEPLRVMREKRMTEVRVWMAFECDIEAARGGPNYLALATAELTLFLAWERGL